MTTHVRAKDGVKRSLAAASARFCPSDGAGRDVILCYHSIHPSKSFRSASPALFERQLDWLEDQAEIVPLAEIRSPSAHPTGRPRVAITFDDGYGDNWDFAFPLLLEHGMSATFFLTAGLIGQDETVIRRFSAIRRSSGDDVRPLTWEQVVEMRSAGAEIGAHTYSHPNLARLPRSEVLDELTRSKEILEQRLQSPVTTLAYPFGKPRRHVSRATVEAVRSVGYRRAVALVTRAVRASDSELMLPRIAVGGDDLETFAQKVTGAWDFLGWWHERAPLWAVRALRPGDERL
jgi:peptidoglycan/xylan/chitin deacetylase (PgdA/CDA1 family)